MQHLEEGTIHAWLDGALPAEESAGVERHVAVCTECASMVAEARGMIAGASRIVSSLDVVPGGVIPKSSGAKKASGSLWRSLRFTPSRAALAATLVIAVSTVLARRHDTVDKIVPTMSSKATAPAVTTAPRPAAPIVTNEQARARQDEKTLAADEARLSRRVVADARTQTKDSIRAEPKSKPFADMAANRPAAQSAPAAPPASAVASAGAVAERSFAKVSADSTRASAKRSTDSAARINPTIANQSFATSKSDAPARFRESAALLSGRTKEFGVGCYQLIDSATKDKALPARFSLDLERADPNSHIVRAMSADGAADTTISRASWQRVSENTIDVRVPSAGKILSLVIQMPAGSVAGFATITGDGPARTATVTRLTCRQ